MKRINLICLFSFLFILGFFSCNDDGFVSNNNQDENNELISVEQKAAMLAEMVDKTVINIDTEEDFSKLRKQFGDARELELTNNGYAKIEEDNNLLRAATASVQKYSIQIHPYSTIPIEYSSFKAKFSQAFCDEVNVGAVNKISSNKTYICGWREAGTSFNLATNQSGGPLASPQAALKPSLKEGYSERGYDAYKNAQNKYILTSHQLHVVCEDVDYATTALELRYPFWDINTGYIINYAILTR